MGDRAEVRDDPARAIVGQDGNPVAPAHPAAAKLGTEARDGPRDLSVRRGSPAVGFGEEHRVGRAFRPVEEKLGQGVSHRVGWMPVF
jgi:hypothetical protein